MREVVDREVVWNNKQMMYMLSYEIKQSELRE